MKNLFLLFFLSLCLTANSQSKIAEKTKNWKAYNGYFNYWWDATNGKLYLLIDKFDQEFLYANSLTAGLGSNDIGLDRGQTGNSRVVFFQKIGKKLLLTQPNYDYRALSNDKNEARAVRESFAQSILWSFPVDEEEGDKVLVDATPFFLRDAHGVVDRLKNMKQGSYTLNEGRSAIYMPNTRNFPQNSEFEAILTFTGGSDAGRFVQSVAPSVEALTVRTHHSFVQLPDKDYKPRRYDALQITPVHYLFSPTDDGMVDYYRRIGAEVGLPILIYNVIPWNTISPDLLMRVSDIEQVVGVKQSGGDIHKLADLLKMNQGRMQIFSAVDDLLYPSFMLGAEGAIAAILTVLPELSVQLWDACQAERYDDARAIHERLLPVWRAINAPEMSARTKAALELQGRRVGNARHPLLPVTPEVEALIAAALEDADVPVAVRR